MNKRARVREDHRNGNVRPIFQNTVQIGPTELTENLNLEAWKRERSQFFKSIRQVQQEANLEPEDADRIAAEAVRAVRDNS